jgi:hypothetical protein
MASQCSVLPSIGSARRYPNVHIVFSGGNAGLDSSNAAREADFLLPVFEGLGLSRDR